MVRRDRIKPAWGLFASAQAAKVAIGFFAGSCAVFLPRLIAFLSTPKSNNLVGTFDFFREDFIVAACAFSGFIGIAVMILKWAEKIDPSSTFMAALSIPAIVAGAFNMATPVSDLDRVSNQVAQIGNSLGIPVIDNAGTLKVAPGPSSERELKHRNSFAYLVTPAFAQNTRTLQAPSSFNPGVFREKQYVVALKSYPNRDAAIKDIGQFRQIARDAVVVEGGNSTFYIIDSTQPRNFADATKRAVELKNSMKDSSASVSLIPVPQ